jgi:hypothetical protein
MAAAGIGLFQAIEDGNVAGVSFLVSGYEGDAGVMEKALLLAVRKDQMGCFRALMNREDRGVLFCPPSLIPGARKAYLLAGELLKGAFVEELLRCRYLTEPVENEHFLAAFLDHTRVLAGAVNARCERVALAVLSERIVGDKKGQIDLEIAFSSFVQAAEKGLALVVRRMKMRVWNIPLPVINAGLRRAAMGGQRAVVKAMLSWPEIKTQLAPGSSGSRAV